jgi:alpha-ketoglutarate-dependent taurine dioxygenase
VAFSRRFGPLLGHVLTQFLKKEHPEVYVLSNVSENGKPIGNHKEGWNWHSDLSYKAEPSLGALLYALEVPPVEGDTFFASMHAAWDALDDDDAGAIRPLTATHSYANYYGKAFADRNAADARAEGRHARRECTRWCARTPRPAACRCTWARTWSRSIEGLPPTRARRCWRA